MIDEPKPKEHVFYIPTSQIVPNPDQPRTEFEETALRGLADSIKQYGILQPLVVTRLERETDSGTAVTYELVAGERRLRASKLVGLPEVPAIIRKEEPQKVRLELALVENVQRKDLNAVERARAYKRLEEEFRMNSVQIGERIGKSREAVSNTMRILQLPEYILESLGHGKITEGHTRPLLMLSDKPEEQRALFQDIIEHGVAVREAERIARRIARERARKSDVPSPETRAVEEELGTVLGARVEIHKAPSGKGKITIEFYSEEELRGIALKLSEQQKREVIDSAPVSPDIQPVVAPVNISSEGDQKEPPPPPAYGDMPFTV